MECDDAVVAPAVGVFAMARRPPRRVRQSFPFQPSRWLFGGVSLRQNKTVPDLDHGGILLRVAGLSLCPVLTHRLQRKGGSAHNEHIQPALVMIVRGLRALWFRAREHPRRQAGSPLTVPCHHATREAWKLGKGILSLERAEDRNGRSRPVMIEADGLCKQFGSFLAVRDVSFSIPKGEVVAFLGPNGAGKTTTMRLLTGFVAPTHGSARIAGIDIQTERIRAAEHLGYLPENGPLYPDLTPMSLLRFFGEARGMSAALVRSRIDSVVSQCALESVAHKPIGKLSKGYRQRVSMAQALLHDPEVLIMDEPTSGLDPNQIRGVRQLIRDLGQSKTVMVSTHILQEVEPVADRVLFIHDGKIVFDGKPAQLASQSGTLEQSFYSLTAQPV